MQAQIDRWASLHPTAKRTGHVFEVPASTLLPRLGLIFVISGVVWWANPKLFWNQKPATLDPEFLEEAKKIGNVAQRVNGSPVYLNPFTHRIPGSIRGPEDVKRALD